MGGGLHRAGVKIREVPVSEIGEDQTRYDYTTSLSFPNMPKYSVAILNIGEPLSANQKLVVSGLSISADTLSICLGLLTRYSTSGEPFTFLGGFFSTNGTFQRLNPFELLPGEQLKIFIGNYSGFDAMIYYSIDAIMSIKR